MKIYHLDQFDNCSTKIIAKLTNHYQALQNFHSLDYFSYIKRINVMSLKRFANLIPIPTHILSRGIYFLLYDSLLLMLFVVDFV